MTSGDNANMAAGSSNMYSLHTLLWYDLRHARHQRRFRKGQNRLIGIRFIISNLISPINLFFPSWIHLLPVFVPMIHTRISVYILCAYVYVYVCICVCVCVYVYVWRVSVCMCLGVHMYNCICLHVYASISIFDISHCLHSYMSICLHVYLYVYIPCIAWGYSLCGSCVSCYESRCQSMSRPPTNWIFIFWSRKNMAMRWWWVIFILFIHTLTPEEYLMDYFSTGERRLKVAKRWS